ncbi:uncharacterized protein BYT42DRAFT_324412 [Radiomyces spectabilis]|uniref:uncharacterized protein n=1 Tax=Radiomyces spectabilis TaxID=64574 RepID=UPI00221EFC51|nr:uncharacterized protein BYT42DRAFT_324412 [Radiomyces spectabilis]KAI8379381.1 hypothetical protein BYT42DRAFT_324412 [Radiomyces spectabilis]
MLETLPAELIAAIATHLPSESTAALSQTCRHCYYATLPVVYNYLCITEPEHLQRLAVRFQLNNVWSQRAEQFVHTISFTKDDKQLFSQMNLARFLGHTLSGVDYQEMTALAGDASTLLLCLPNLQSLQIEWVFPPSKDYFYALCRIMEHLSLLYPEPVERSNGSLTVRFTHMTVY